MQNIEVRIRILSGISNLNILLDAASKRVTAGMRNQTLHIFQYIYIIPLKQRLSNTDIIGCHCHFKMVVVLLVSWSLETNQVLIFENSNPK